MSGDDWGFVILGIGAAGWAVALWFKIDTIRTRRKIREINERMGRR